MPMLTLGLVWVEDSLAVSRAGHEAVHGARGALDVGETCPDLDSIEAVAGERNIFGTGLVPVGEGITHVGFKAVRAPVADEAGVEHVLGVELGCLVLAEADWAAGARPRVLC